MTTRDDGGNPLAPPHPHDDHLRLCWKICRFGMERVGEAESRERVLSWIERMRPRFPGSPYLEQWTRIVAGGAPELAREVLSTPDFFSLEPARRGFWRPLIQSQPFTCLLPGRTTRERRAVLSRLP